MFVCHGSKLFTAAMKCKYCITQLSMPKYQKRCLQTCCAVIVQKENERVRDIN